MAVSDTVSRASRLSSGFIALACLLLPVLRTQISLWVIVAGYLVLWALSLALADANVGLLVARDPPKDAFLGKVCVVVGASRGVGAALAKDLCKRGAKLVLASRDSAALAALADEFEGEHKGAIQCAPVDVLSSGDVLAAWVDRVATVHGRIDYAFLASGSSQAALAECTTHDTGVQVLRLNGEGCINAGRALLRQLRAQSDPSALVAIASMAARVPSPGQAEYAAAKHAVLGYFRSVAFEVPSGRPAVTVVCPGPIAGDAERSVYGPSGRVVKTEDARQQRKKVGQARCVQLICRAAYGAHREAWIAKHPVLVLAMLGRLLPGVADVVLSAAGRARAQALQAGRSGYESKLSELWSNKQA